MRYMRRILICLFILGVVVACGQRSKKVYLEKDGCLYEVADQVSFYYPKDFEINSSNDNKEELQLIKEQQLLTYSTTIDDTDNKVEDMPNLYGGQLEEDGAQDVVMSSVELDSGITCYEYTGMYTATGLKFKHIIYFTPDAAYIYAYQAPQDVYDDNIAVITQFLESLTVHRELSSLD